MKFYHFWPDDEKWSRKNIFEILPFALRNYEHIFYFIERRIFAKVTNSVKKETIFAHGGISKKFFVVYVLMVTEILSQKFHPCSIAIGETMVELKQNKSKIKEFPNKIKEFPNVIK